MRMPVLTIYLVTLLNLVSIRAVVVLSFLTHLILVILADVRRRNATGISTLLLQLADSVARWAPTFALGKLAVGSTPQEQQLATLWAALLLLHAARPDNIAAYSLEDTVLSWRQAIEVFPQMLFGPLYILSKNIVLSISGDTMLFGPSILCFIAIVKYVETACFAVSRANMENMRTSSKNEKIPITLTSNPGRSLGSVGSREQGNEQILLVAHGMRHITKGAFIDYDFLADRDFDIKEVLPKEWSDNEILYRVVDMELSLMYDMLYTKASVVYTWVGYAIRVISPFATATAFLLFWFQSKGGLWMADVLITYILLGTTVLLDIVFLLRAVASTWTYSFLKDRPRCWLYHALLCSGRWRLLRRFIVSLNLWRFLSNKEPTSYRMWAGTIGQYNLLDECTDGTNSWLEMIKPLAEKMSIGGHFMEYQYHYSNGYSMSSDSDVRKLLFERIWKCLKSAYTAPKRVEAEEKKKKEEEAKKKKKQEVPPKIAPTYRRELEEALNFAPAFQEAILIWHIATDVFLLKSHRQLRTPSSYKQVQAIKVLSNYMVFLVAVRPSMLPGLKLRSLYEDTQKKLVEILTEEGSSNSLVADKKKLVNKLLELEQTTPKSSNEGKKNRLSWKPGYNSRRRMSQEKTSLYDKNVILSDGSKFAMMLLRLIGDAHSQDIDISSTSYGSDRYIRLEEMVPIIKDRIQRKISLLKDTFLNTANSMEDKLDHFNPDHYLPKVISEWKEKSGVPLPVMIPELQDILRMIWNWRKMDSDEILFLLDNYLRQLIPKMNGLFKFSEMLDLIFEAWVHFLMFASVRCTRDSHAKQLGCGGELTTIVWIITEHAGIFRIHGDESPEKDLFPF